MGRHALNGASILSGVFMIAWIGCLWPSNSAEAAFGTGLPSGPGSRTPTQFMICQSSSSAGLLTELGGEGKCEGEQPKTLLLKPSVPSGVNQERKFDPASFIRRLLGVDVRSATLGDLKQYNVEIHGGVVILVTYSHSPLVDVGFETNDLIMEVEGRPIQGIRNFAEQVLRLREKKRILMLGLDHRTGRVGYVQVVVP